MTSKKYMVCARCFTFNQAEYIADTLNGFCIQTTSFPFVCVIVDDASTDGEQEVINSYLQNNFNLKDENTIRKEETDDYQLLFAQHKTNINCYFAVLLLKYNHHKKKRKTPYFREWVEAAKYQASCEGDDYWIDRYRLQKQVDFLEKNQNYSAVFADIVFRNETVTPITEIKTTIKQSIFTIKDVYRGKVFPLNSICVRSEVWSLLKNIKRIKANGDIKIAYTIAKAGDVYKMDDFFSVYRKTGKGLSSHWSAKTQFIHDINEWYSFFNQLGFPDKNNHAHFQARLINDYGYVYGWRGFPYNEIKKCLFIECWYVYIYDSINYFFMRLGKSIYYRVTKLLKRGTN